MSLIQKTRERAAWIVSGAIALALIAFIVQDGLRSGSKLFGGNTTTVGIINGKKIEYLDYQARLKQVEDNYQQNGVNIDDNMRQNLQSRLWDDYVQNTLVAQQSKELGIEVTQKELGDVLYGSNPPEWLKRQFTDPKTGIYNANEAYQQLQQLSRQKNNPAYKTIFDVYIPEAAKQRLREKYLALLSNSYYIPKWLLEKTNTENSQQATISYVNVPYSTISDSTLQPVSDAEIEAYVGARKEQYQQPASRSMDYVSFNAAPTTDDSAAIYKTIIAQKEPFAQATDAAGFLVQNGSENSFDGTYQLKSKLTGKYKDSLIDLPKGQVFGPYIDDNKYVLAKKIEERSLPDSVKCRHILISTQNGLPDSTAKKRIDSIAAAIKGGADFATLCLQYSDDPGSKEKGGEYTFPYSQFGQLDKTFAETIFYGKTGDKKVVKSSFGYHYIEVLDQKSFEPAYQIAYLSKAIYASDQTMNTAMGLAAQFAAESRTYEQLSANAKKEKRNMLSANDIKPMDYSINGLGTSREVIQWMYKAKTGDVMDQPVLVGDKYIVGVLTDVQEKGVMSAKKARPLVEYLIRNKKKAERIAAKIGTAATLEAVGQATGQPVATADSIRFSGAYIPNVGQELKVVGASFDKDYEKGISKPIEGNGGVYVIKVDKITAVPNMSLDVVQEKEAMKQQSAQMINYQALQVLKNAATIQDFRYKFY